MNNTRRRAHALAVVTTLAALVLSACSKSDRPQASSSTTQPSTGVSPATQSPTVEPPSVGSLAIRVAGSSLVDGGGRPIRVLGVNRSGGEYACIQGWGIFDGPVDDAAIAAMAAWRINTVRVPLNEDCWLGINGVKPEFGGDNYRQAIRAFVTRLHNHGLFVILDNHVAGGGSTPSTEILPMADVDHAPPFWKSLASTFRDDPAVLFDLYNEPHDVSWDCWRDGCKTSGYTTVGMQQLLNTVRASGAHQPVLVGGLGYAGDPSEWLSHAPSDSAAQVVMSLHTYDFSPCDDACRSTAVEIARHMPVIAGEIGENDCAHGYIDTLMNWADAHGISYVGWTWNSGGGWTCKGGPTLITAYDGTPTGFGKGFRDHLAAIHK